MPRAFVLAAALVLATETLIAVACPANLGRHAVDDLLARLDEGRSWRPIVLLGDSATITALQGTPISDRVNDLACMAVVSLAGQYYLQARQGEGFPPPRVVVLDVIPESYGYFLNQAWHRDYFETCFDRWGELMDFLRMTRRKGQWLRMAMHKVVYVPSYRARGTIGRTLAPYIHFFEDRESGRWQVSRLPQRSRVLNDLGKRATLRHFEFPDLPRRYLEKLASELERVDATLVLMTGPLPVSVLAGWRTSGYLEEYETALRGIAAVHRNVVIDPVDQFAEFRDEQMQDSTHLTWEVQRTYGAMLSRRIEALLADAESRRSNK